MASRLYTHLVLLAASLFILSGISFNSAFRTSSGIWKRLFLGVLAACFLLVSMVYTWILFQRPPHRQSLGTVTRHLLLAALSRHTGKRALKKLLASCKDPMQHQTRLLRWIIQRNGNTVYGREHHLSDISSLEDFRRRHPLTGYEHFRSYVDRMTEGERDVLIAGAPTSYIRTTGTTGKPKYIPQIGRMDAFRDIISLIFYTYAKFYQTRLLGKWLYFYVAPVISKTKSGADIETAATLPDGYDWALAQYVSPPASFKIGTMREAIYVQLLFGLLDPDISSLVVGFVHFLESAMALLETQWKQLVRDIEFGTLNPQLNILQDIRDRITEELRTFGGDPGRAVQLQTEFEKGFQGIITRIWPRLPAISGIDSTGSWPKLSRTHAEGLPLLSPFYGCSEAFLSVSLGPEYIQGGYIPMVDQVITEFIKEEDMSSSEPATYFLNEVEKGQRYEIVVTQKHGLYRYRMGDVVRIEGFRQNMPIIEFMYRTGQMLNLRYEKLDQRVVSDSIRAAVARWPGIALREFAAAESTILTNDCSVFEPGEIMPYYLIFLELETSAKAPSADEKQTIDAELRLRNSDYERLRHEGSISYPRVHAVRQGTFEALQDYLLENTGASANQYKVPRKLRTYAMLDVILNNLVE